MTVRGRGAGGIAARPRGLRLAAGVLIVAGAVACAPAGSPVDPDADRVRLLGAVPPTAAARGVYVFEPATAGDLSPGSLLGPILGPLVDEASVVVETMAPPLTLLAGVPADTDVAPGAERVGDVVITGRSADVADAASRLRAGATPRGMLAVLAASGAPVGYTGPLPRPPAGEDRGLGDGEYALFATPERIEVLVRPSVPLQPAADLVRRRLADGAPPGSPGKPWSALLRDATVAVENGLVRVEAVPDGLDGRLLRAFIDRQDLTFIAG